MEKDEHSLYDEEEFNPNTWIKGIAKELGVPTHRLHVLASHRDPFNKGTEGDWEKAKWFKKMYDRFGYDQMHLRRLHYRMVNAEEGLVSWDGTPYENDKLHWNHLGEAFIIARILGVVDAGGFVDRRVQASRIDSMDVHGMPEADFWAEPPDIPGLPQAPGRFVPIIPNPSVFSVLNPEPEFGVTGYDYDSSLQPNLVEIWSEKSGDDRLLRNIAYRYRINYQPGIGYASITNIKKMLKRVADHDKPGRILYVSDFDKAGQNMPIQVGRHSQFAVWELEELAEKVAPDIMVDNVALTADQVEELDLPPIPGTTKREIDALEALHPGKLGEYVTERVEELLDLDLEEEVEKAEEEARHAVKTELDSIMEEHQEKLEEIQEEAQEIVDRYNQYYRTLGEKVADRYGKLQERYERHIADLRRDLQREEDEIRAEVEGLEVDLPEIPVGEVETKRTGWLFDSEREFLEQTIRFRRAQGKE